MVLNVSKRKQVSCVLTTHVFAMKSLLAFPRLQQCHSILSWTLQSSRFWNTVKAMDVFKGLFQTAGRSCVLWELTCILLDVDDDLFPTPAVAQICLQPMYDCPENPLHKPKKVKSNHFFHRSVLANEILESIAPLLSSLWASVAIQSCTLHCHLYGRWYLVNK